MEKMEKVFKSYRGLILFYIVVAILTLMLTKKIERINSQVENSNEIEVRYYA